MVIVFSDVQMLANIVLAKHSRRASSGCVRGEGHEGQPSVKGVYGRAKSRERDTGSEGTFLLIGPKYGSQTGGITQLAATRHIKL